MSSVYSVISVYLRRSKGIRILHVADTHIGFDWPLRPRVERRRRGPDFLARFEEALAPALRGEVDLVVHGGDLLHRPRLPLAIVQAALDPLLRVAERGVPVFLVPGNHERSRIPYPLLAQHENLHIFHRPHTFVVGVVGVGGIAVSGFPFARRADFARRIEETGWRGREARFRLLCMHQAVAGARVGVQDFMFRRGPDVVQHDEIPDTFDAVLCGHIHRAQALTDGAAPVLYAGSVERTSFQEREETKGYMRVRVGRRTTWDFVPLAARPMYVVDDPDRLKELPPDAVVRIDGSGMSSARLRTLVPNTMNVSVARAR